MLKKVRKPEVSCVIIQEQSLASSDVQIQSDDENGCCTEEEQAVEETGDRKRRKSGVANKPWNQLSPTTKMSITEPARIVINSISREYNVSYDEVHNFIKKV